MPLAERQTIMERIEELRGGRALVCFFNFDRGSTPSIPGLQTQIATDAKGPLYKVLKETVPPNRKLDLCLYTRGGETNAVWPLVSILREFDPDFEVLVPFRCHSSGTLLALGAKKIVMTPLAELSPIDPSTGNQFNPTDPNDSTKRLGIAVEDVQAYRNFILDQFKVKGDGDKDTALARDVLRPFVDRLTDRVHPLALGNVHRVHQQIKKLGTKLLGLHPIKGRKLDTVIDSLTTGYYSHLHMINRNEAATILGSTQLVRSSRELDDVLDELMRGYEESFALGSPFYLAAEMKDDQAKDLRFAGSVIESRCCAFIYETRANVRQHSQLPPNVQVQLPAGQQLPLIPGLPRHYNVDIKNQGWVKNERPEGVTL